MVFALIGIAIICVFAQVQGKASLEFGYVPESGIFRAYPIESYTDTSKIFYATSSVVLPILKYFFVSSSVDVYICSTTLSGVLPVYFNPLTTGYQIGAGAVYGPITMGIEHECTHPDTVNGQQLIFGDAAYTKIYARYDYKF